MPYRIVHRPSPPVHKLEYADDDLDSAIAWLKHLQEQAPYENFEIVKVSEDKERREITPMVIEAVDNPAGLPVKK